MFHCDKFISSINIFRKWWRICEWLIAVFPVLNKLSDVSLLIAVILSVLLVNDTNISVFKSKLEERLNFKIKQLEISMINHINEKIDKVTEKIIDIIINRNLEKETEKRVDVKIKKTRKKDEQV